MIARRIIVVSLLLSWIASACAAAAPATPAAPSYNPPPPQQQQAPAATQPAAAPGQPPVYVPPPAEAGRSLESGSPAADSLCCPPPYPPYPPPFPTPTYEVPPPQRDGAYSPFTDTRFDQLSTFAMDVDTASYTKIREYLNGGSLPPSDLVRIEEVVNYFNMEYPDPPSGAFSINLEGGPSPFGGEGTWLLRVGIQGRHIAGWERKDALLTFVIDVSGSMADEDRISMVKYGLNRLVDRLGPNDRVAIVAFTDTAWVVLEPTAVESRYRILDAINSLYPMNSTNTEAGLRLGYDLAYRNYRDGAINRVILASDGVANVGNTDPGVLARYAQDYYGRNIFLSTVGVGHGNYNDALMEQLADKGNGVYSFLDSNQAAERIFSQDIEGTLQTIAKDAKIQVDFNPSIVRAYRLLGYENRAVADRDFRNDAVDAGEVGAGHSVTALYELQLAGEGGGDAAVVRVRYEDPDTRAVAELSAAIGRADFQRNFSRTSPRFQLAVAAAQFAQILRAGPWGQADGLSSLSALAWAVQRQLPFDGDVYEFAQLVDRAASLMR